MKATTVLTNRLRTKAHELLTLLTPDLSGSRYSFSDARSYWENVPRAIGSNPINTDEAREVSDEALVDQFHRELTIARNKIERKVGFKRAIELIEDLETPRVMDYGSGVGFYGHEMLRSHSGARVTFVDINASNLAVVERISNAVGFGSRADYIVVNDIRARDLQFSVNFDAVMSMGVLHHTPHAREIVARIATFMKPGAVFLALLYNRRYWKDMALRARCRINNATFGKMTDPSVGEEANPFSEPYTLKKTRRLFAGFQMIGVDSPNPYYDIYRFRKPSGPDDPTTAWLRWP